jgi:hypothetical protein
MNSLVNEDALTVADRNVGFVIPDEQFFTRLLRSGAQPRNLTGKPANNEDGKAGPQANSLQAKPDSNTGFAGSLFGRTTGSLITEFSFFSASASRASSFKNENSVMSEPVVRPNKEPAKPVLESESFFPPLLREPPHSSF